MIVGAGNVEDAVVVAVESGVRHVEFELGGAVVVGAAAVDGGGGGAAVDE